MRPIFGCKLLVVGCLFLSIAGADDVGFASLKIGIGSRECGMGDVGTAAAQGPQGVYWNPALSGWARHFEASFSYADWFLDMSKSAVFVVRPLPIFVLGLGATVFNAGQVEYREDKPSETPIGTFSPFDYSLYLNLSRSLQPGLALGVTGRYYYQKILDRSASGFGADLGLAYEPQPRLKVGAAIVDLGSTLHFKFADFALPTRAQAGLSYALPLGRSELTGAADLGYYFFDQRVLANVGAEFALNRVLALRAGWRFFDPTGHLSVGLGFKPKGLRLEYSLSPYDLSLGTTQRLALGFGY
jgi:opacity protein-like surface antigen